MWLWHFAAVRPSLPVTALYAAKPSVRSLPLVPPRTRVGDAASAASVEDEGDRAAADEDPDPRLLVVAEETDGRRLVRVHDVGLTHGFAEVRVDRLELLRDADE